MATGPLDKIGRDEVNECRTVITPRGPVQFTDIGTGPPILYFHGTGVASDFIVPLEKMLLEDGFRLIVPNRPGYGETPLTGNESSTQCADLSAELLTILGIERSAAMGSSGGGLFAAAFAARHPERTACLVLECAQLHRWDDRRWLPPANQWMLPLLVRPLLRRLLLRSYRWQFRWQTPAKFLRFESGSRYPDLANDTAALELAAICVEAMRRCLRQPKGFNNDFQVFLNVQTLPLGAIACPTLVIHDPMDPVAPVAHADWACDCIPNAQRFDVEAGGHLI
jgi:pimeloyl-ACP methyl ester carboxylesterase